MEYYFNELSCAQIPPDRTAVFGWVGQFAKTCIEVKKIGFKTFRSDIYLSEIEIMEGYRLGEWMKDRSVGDRDLQRRFKLLDVQLPILNADDEILSRMEWSIFYHSERRCRGLAVAYLKNSLSVSFICHNDWFLDAIEIQHEYIDESNAENIAIIPVSVRHASCPEHIEIHREFAIEKLKTLPPPPNWKPIENYLPHVEISNLLLSVQTFYENNRRKSRGEQIATIRVIGFQVAELNCYQKDEERTRKNSTNEKIRDIYKSRNDAGNPIFLSVDVEVGAFEICDHNGIHIEEILFDGTPNGGQELDHSIQL